MDALPSAPSAPPEAPDETIARLTAELREAHDQQAATTEILEIINRSPGDLVRVFDAILEKAHTLCDAERGALATFDGELFRARATRGMPEEFAAFLRRGFRPPPVFAEPLARGEHLHIHDLAAFAAESSPATAGFFQPALELAGTRTIVTVPLCRDSVLLGYIAAYRTEVRPFSEKQIALLQNFAAHAEIAMENARLLTETREALEQQTATAEVLQVINSSPGDLAPVFDAMLEKAMRLCTAEFGEFFITEGERLRAIAIRGVPEAFAEFRYRNPAPPIPGSITARILAGEPVIHVADVKDDDLYRRGDPQRRALVDLGGARTFLSITLIKDRAVLGSINMYRQEVRPFSDKQIALLQNFAAQAVIAMENARLLTETREALEQQTATAEILRVISGSPTDVQPTFDAIATSATTLCGAASGSVFQFDGSLIHLAATYNTSAGEIDAIRRVFPLPPGRGSVTARAILTRGLVHVADLATDPEYTQASIAASGLRATLSVPMLRDGSAIGAITVSRREAEPFSEVQIDLLKTFADQAVIAIENVRLFNELNERTRDLQESLEYQTATSDVLQVISRSTFDLQPVLDTLVETAARLCGADMGGIATRQGEVFRTTASYAASPEWNAFVRTRPLTPGRDTITGRALLARQPVQIADITADPEYKMPETATVGNMRTMIGVPLLREGEPIGVMQLARSRVEPFTRRQIELVRTFADQAVIAMENARLINETREALEQQTATAEVLQVINSSPGNLTPVFDAMLEKAMRLGEAAFGMLHTFDGKGFSPAAMRGVPEAYSRYRQQHPLVIGRSSGPDRIMRGEKVVHFVDVETDPAYQVGQSSDRAVIDLAGARSILSIALGREDALLGMFTVFRQEVRPFSDKQIALLENFAAQAVIAMENARLINETREALEQQTATAEVLQVINSSPGDLAPVFDAMLEKAMRLCQAAFGGLFVHDGERLHAVATRGLPGSLNDVVRQEFAVNPDSPILRGATIDHIIDLANEPFVNPGRAAAVELGGARTMLNVALRKDDVLLGNFSVFRQEVRPFTDKQIALLQNFAAQAVIAIENARLITETREALEQQSATAEVLGVINSSPGDLTPVFDAILEKAHSLCGVASGTLQLYDGETFHAAAVHGLPEKLADFLRRGYHAGPNLPQAKLIAGEPLAHVADLAEVDDPGARTAVELGGIRSILCVALRKDNTLLGFISAARFEVRPFSEKEIKVLEGFAAQAVIAIENARLINETREALEQQTATAEVLQVINSSPGDLAPVFEAMLEKATRLCEAETGVLWTYYGDQMQASAILGASPEYAEFLREGPRPLSPTHQLLQQGERLIQVADVLAYEGYHAGWEMARALFDLGGVRTILLVPLRKDQMVLGAFAVYRQNVRPFTDKQIAILENFAAQAVIAMENARLINETREALEQQTATAEVLQVINSSPGDLAPVFDAMLEKAMRLCQATGGALRSYDGDAFHAVAMRGMPREFLQATRKVRPDPDSGLGRIERGEHVVQVGDLTDASHPRAGTESRRWMTELGGVATSLWVALRKEATLLGTFVLYREEVRPFSDKEISLVQNFAAQAVIATENARLLTETREALEQQTATAEVLQVINSSPGNLAPVFERILEKAHALCGAEIGSLTIYDGVENRAVATRGLAPSLADRLRQGFRPGPAHPIQKLLSGARIVQVPDLGESADPIARESFELAGIRTSLYVPLRKDDRLLGQIVASRQEVRPFSEKDITLLENFATQAVIAMENARLITETREALEQQTATAEVLGVINSSPGDLAPVFDAILEKAHSLCGAAKGSLVTVDGEHFRTVATRGLSEPYVAILGEGQHNPPGSAPDRLLQGESIVHLPDARDSEFPVPGAAAQLEGARTIVYVPLRKDSALLGYLTAYRQEVRPFSDKQIALLQNFAAQAVIAMENARLLTETRESLEQQTATAEVLQVINSSPGDLPPVFDAILEKAMHLCEAAFGILWVHEDGRYHAPALRGVPPAFAEFLREPVGPFHQGSGLARLLQGEDLIINEDMSAEEIYRVGDPLRRAIVDLGGARTAVTVSLRKDETLLGAFTVFRQEVRRFTDKQIALMQSFGAQAVIAMENARLITELQQRTGDLEESLEYQTATSDVLKVISGSTFDLQPVLETVTETAARLCEAEMGGIMRREGEVYRVATTFGYSPEYRSFIESHPVTPDRGNITSRVVAEGRAVQIADAAADPEYKLTEAVTIGRGRTHLGVPLLRENVPIGVIVLARHLVRPFTEKQIALVTTFADQAVIAIENARLFNELRARTAELVRSVEELQLLGEVGQAVSSALDVRSVMSTILTRSVGMTGADAGAVFRYRPADRTYSLVEAFGWDEALSRSVGGWRIGESETAMGEAAARRAPFQSPISNSGRAGHCATSVSPPVTAPC